MNNQPLESLFARLSAPTSLNLILLLSVILEEQSWHCWPTFEEVKTCFISGSKVANSKTKSGRRRKHWRRIRRWRLWNSVGTKNIWMEKRLGSEVMALILWSKMVAKIASLMYTTYLKTQRVFIVWVSYSLDVYYLWNFIFISLLGAF